MDRYSDEYLTKFIELAFRSVLGRNSDKVGRTAYLRLLKGGGDFLRALELLVESDEYKKGVGEQFRREYDYARDDRISRYFTPQVRSMTQRLMEERHVSFDEFGRHLAAAHEQNMKSAKPLGGQEDYAEYHKTRFWEIVNGVGVLLREMGRARPLILDVGYSVNTLALQGVYPEAMVYTADRPGISLGGSPGPKGFSVDLTADDLVQRDLGMRFDVIVFAEVIEHLLASPVKILRFLLKHLERDGYILITTPNVFSYQKLERIDRRFSPQPIYPEHYRSTDAPHFHVREYSMGELVEISEKAGGAPVGLFFSGCWDPPEMLPQIPFEQRSNLCVVIQNRPPPN